MTGGDTTQTAYTVGQAAAALGVSRRTIERRLASGALSATLTQQGTQQVRMIDGAELARFAEAYGHAQAVTKPSATEGNVAALAATVESQDRLIAALEGEVRFLREQLAQATEQLAQLTVRALPPAQPGRQWRWPWQRDRREE